jgi:hypothetical protein
MEAHISVILAAQRNTSIGRIPKKLVCLPVNARYAAKPRKTG